MQKEVKSIQKEVKSIQNSHKKVWPSKHLGEKSCEIKGGSHEIATMIIDFSA